LLALTQIGQDSPYFKKLRDILRISSATAESIDTLGHSSPTHTDILVETTASFLVIRYWKVGVLKTHPPSKTNSPGKKKIAADNLLRQTYRMINSEEHVSN